MTNKTFLPAAALAAATAHGVADARSQMRAVGSSTVYPFSKGVAERVAGANPRLGTSIIESTGTGAGFKLFCAGVGARFPDVSNASRRIKASKAKQCAANGVRQITENQIGVDGLAAATARSSQLSGLTQRDIYLAIAKMMTPPCEANPSMAKESAIGPKGYLVQHGLIAAPTPACARSQMAARNLVPLNLASIK